jgi:hypothetical protein
VSKIVWRSPMKKRSILWRLSHFSSLLGQFRGKISYGSKFLFCYINTKFCDRAKMLKMSFPPAVLVSNPSLKERKATPLFSSDSTVAIKCFSDRPKRSIFFCHDQRVTKLDDTQQLLQTWAVFLAPLATSL